eukprot:1295964-Pyramimonas_sp.AAC.1
MSSGYSCTDKRGGVLFKVVLSLEISSRLMANSENLCDDYTDGCGLCGPFQKGDFARHLNDLDDDAFAHSLLLVGEIQRQ